MPYKTSSWKDKVDPLLVEMIKVFLKIIDAATISEKNFAKDKTDLNNVSENRSFKNFYESDSLKRLLLNFMQKISGNITIRFAGDEKELRKCLNNFSVSNSGEIDIGEAEKIIPKAEFEAMFDGEMVLCVHFVVMCVASALVHKKPLKVLYQEARERNMISLYKLLQIDKTIIDHEWFQSLVMKEMIADNVIFFKKVGAAFGTQPPIGRLKHNRLILIMFLFWKLGLDKLTNPELVSLLEECDFKIHDEIESFRRRILSPVKAFYKKYPSI